jgi:RNA polymerase sigma-70 factor (ECF subfamily)
MSKDCQAADRFLGLLQPIERDLEVYGRRLIFEARDLPDAIQNAVLRAYHAFDRYHDDASFRGWMFKILTNEVFALNRKRGRIAKFEVAIPAEDLDQFADAVCAGESSDLAGSWEILAESFDQDILTALESLNEAERAVLLLRSVGQLRYREIAEALEIPMGSVMGNLARARQKMRAAIVRARRRAAP